jgi:hypothetical protein
VAGIKVPTVTEFASPIDIVKKSNGSDRICVDHRELKEITV